MNNLKDFVDFICANDGIGNKAALISKVLDEFHLIPDRSVYYCDSFAVRFCYSSSGSFSNTVLSLSNLQKFDRIPFIVCLVKQDENRLLLANSSFIIKVSHSSQNLTAKNIKGSFNGSDILKNIEGIENNRDNLMRLFAIHAEISFEENLLRIVEMTNNIIPSGKKFNVDDKDKKNILESINRATIFLNRTEYHTLKVELDQKVAQHSNEIIIASHIENTNIRGRLIEYFISGSNEELKSKLSAEINKEYGKLPTFKTKNTFGDYSRMFEEHHTETDIKTKILLLNSNPKAYNIDKFLEFHSQDNTIFFFYFIGINNGNICNTILVSPFQKDIVDSTITLRHWAGRNSRGVTQFDGEIIKKLLLNPNNEIDKDRATILLDKLCNL